MTSLPYQGLLSKVVSLLQRVYDLRKLVGLPGLGHLHLRNSRLDVYGLFPSLTAFTGAFNFPPPRKF